VKTKVRVYSIIKTVFIHVGTVCILLSHAAGSFSEEFEPVTSPVMLVCGQALGPILSDNAADRYYYASLPPETEYFDFSVSHFSPLVYAPLINSSDFSDQVITAVSFPPKKRILVSVIAFFNYSGFDTMDNFGNADGTRSTVWSTVLLVPVTVKIIERQYFRITAGAGFGGWMFSSARNRSAGMLLSPSVYADIGRRIHMSAGVINAGLPVYSGIYEDSLSFSPAFQTAFSITLLQNKSKTHAAVKAGSGVRIKQNSLPEIDVGVSASAGRWGVKKQTMLLVYSGVKIDTTIPDHPAAGTGFTAGIPVGKHIVEISTGFVRSMVKGSFENSTTLTLRW